jgi:outer membrane protein TolC
MKRYLLIIIVIASIKSGCAFEDKPWKTHWLESPINYDPSGVQTSLDNKNSFPIDKSLTSSESKKSITDGSLQMHDIHKKTADDVALKTENQYPIDLPTVLRLAGANHLDIALFRQKLYEAYSNAQVAAERFIPTLTQGVLFQRREGSVQRSTGEFISVDAQQTFIGGNISLDWELGEAIYSTLAEMQRYHASKAALEAKVHDAILEAAIAYFLLVREQAMVVISRQSVEISEKLVRQTADAVLQGMGFKGDVLRAKAQLSANKLVLTEAKESFKMASITLATILRLNSDLELYSVEKVVVPVKMVNDREILSDLIKRAMLQRPELKEADADLRAIKNEVTGAVWGPLIPSLRAEAGAGGLGPVPSDLSSREDYRISVGWKVGPGGIFDIGRQHVTKSQHETQRVRIAKLMQKVEEEVRIAYTQVLAKAEQIKIAEEGLSDALESLKLNQERQMKGIGIPLEVLQAEEASTKARQNHLSAIIEYNKAQYTLFTKIGMNLIEGKDISISD